MMRSGANACSLRVGSRAKCSLTRSSSSVTCEGFAQCIDLTKGEAVGIDLGHVACATVGMHGQAAVAASVVMPLYSLRSTAACGLPTLFSASSSLKNERFQSCLKNTTLIRSVIS